MPLKRSKGKKIKKARRIYIASSNNTQSNFTPKNYIRRDFGFAHCFPKPVFQIPRLQKCRKMNSNRSPIFNLCLALPVAYFSILQFFIILINTTGSLKLKRVRIPSMTRKFLANYVKKVASAVPGLHVVDVDIALNELCKDDQKLEQILLGRELHISLGRTVPIQVHQIDSIVAMLRQKFQSQRGYWIEFNKWEVFVNDDMTRTFLSLEVTGGLTEICRQIQIVEDIYRMHGLPEFYKDPRPHASLIWALGDISGMLKKVVSDLDRFRNGPSASQKHIFMCKFSGIECKIGKMSYNICGPRDQ